MLGHTYRFTVKNETGQTIAASSIFVRARRWKFSSDGSLAFEASESTVLSNSSTLANGSFLAGTTQDNTTDKWVGGQFEFTVTAPTSANGNVICYVERSTDGGTDWDSNGLGRVVAVLNFTASGTKTKHFVI